MHPDTGTKPPDTTSAEPLLAATRRQAVRFAAFMVALNLALPLLLWLVAALRGDELWSYLQGEENAVTWFSSVQLLLVGLSAWFNFAAQAVLDPDRARRGWIWLVFGAGFVTLGVDERFSFHERLRDEVVAPADRFTEISFLEPGDIGLYIVFLVGLVCAVFLLRQLKRNPPALPLFLSALILSLVIVVMDSLRGEISYNLPMADFWNYVFEEIGELWAQCLFLLSFLVVLRARLTPSTETARLDAGSAIAATRRQVRFAGMFLIALGVAVPPVVVLLAPALGEEPFRLFDNTYNPLAWLSSVLLVLLSLVAYLNHLTAPGSRSPWPVFAAGFLFLALDERFEIHEALREGLFEPARLFSGTWIETGDIGLHLYLLAGLAGSWFLRDALRRYPPAAMWYAAALGASAVVVLIGGMDHALVRNWPAPDAWDSIFDAIAKPWTQVLFLVALLTVLDRQLAEAEAVRPTRPGSVAGR